MWCLSSGPQTISFEVVDSLLQKREGGIRFTAILINSRNIQWLKIVRKISLMCGSPTSLALTPFPIELPLFPSVLDLDF